jgi:predicted nucleic acid-binding protein
MSVVSDTTAITTLLKAKQERLLRELFERVLVPQAVWDELKEFHIELPKFIDLHPATDASQRLPGTELLGRGEAEALLLAKQLNAQLLLTDDRKARRAARRLQIPCIGLVGMIVHAKRRGRISSVREMLQLLETDGGLYLSDAVVSDALRLAGEV